MNAGLHVAALDALATHVVMLDPEGVIVYVNRAWVDFSVANGGPGADGWIGCNYLQACRDGDGDDPSPGLARDGIRSVQNGLRLEYSIEYPCHGPAEKRWFQMRVLRLEHPDARGYCLITHDNVTERVLAEKRLLELQDVDPVTRLARWRRFERQWSVEWGRGLRFQHPLLLLWFGLGEATLAAGPSERDRSLRHLGAALREQARRPGDLAARAPGEACVLLLPGAAYEVVPLVLEAIGSQMASYVGDGEVAPEPGRVGGWIARAGRLVPQRDLDPSRTLADLLGRMCASDDAHALHEGPGSGPALRACALG